MIKGGPKIINDGLVLCLDAHDAKSYAGEPTTNLSAAAGYPNFSNWAVEGTAEKISAGYNFQGQPVYKCNTQVNTVYLAIYRIITGLRTAASGGYVTVSVWVKNPNPTSYNFYAYIGHDFSSTRTLAADSDWQRIEWTVLESSMNDDYVEFRPYTNTAGVYIHMTMPQVEVKTYATPWVDDSRSATNGWVDRTTNNNDGTLTNMIGTEATHYRDGQVIMPVSASYLNFDGSDDYVTVSVTGTKTVEVWFNPDTTSGTNVLYGPYANGRDNWLDFSTTVRLLATESADTNNFTIAGGSISAGNWYQAVAIIDGTTATLYLNGSQVATTTKTFTIGSWSGNADIGKRGALSQNYANAQIAVVRAYNKPLTAAEVLSNYNATKERFS